MERAEMLNLIAEQKAEQKRLLKEAAVIGGYIFTLEQALGIKLVEETTS